MSKKNTLEAKQLRRANKQKDRGYPEYYTMVTNDKGYSKLVGPNDKPKVDVMKKVFSKIYMNGFFAMLGITEKPEVVEAEVVA